MFGQADVTLRFLLRAQGFKADFTSGLFGFLYSSSKIAMAGAGPSDGRSADVQHAIVASIPNSISLSFVVETK